MQISYYRHNKFQTWGAIRQNAIPFNELTFVLKGELKYSVDGQDFTVGAGNCIYINKGALRERQAAKATDYVSFNFHGEICGELPTLVKDCVGSETNQLIAVCDGVYRKYPSWANIMDGVLKTLIALLQARVANREEHPVVLKIKRLVRANLAQKITLKNIAENVGYSPNYCDTLFKKHSGESLINYVIDSRITEAKLLLTEGALSLSQVAEAVGFEDYNYFSRLFKQKTGYTPGEYKNKQN